MESNGISAQNGVFRNKYPCEVAYEEIKLSLIPYESSLMVLEKPNQKKRVPD